MLAHTRPTYLITLGFTLVTSPVFASDPALTYRGVSLGDPVQKVQTLAANEFQRVEVIEPRATYDVYAIKAGDDEGMRGEGCAYRATSNRQKNCLTVRYYFSMQQELLHVYVEQSFKPPVSLASLLDRLAKTYGAPRSTFREQIPASPPLNTMFVSPAAQVISSVWGGNKTPVDPYSNSRYPADSMKAIGGKFVSTSIHHEGGLVNGYSLRILDSASVEKLSAETMAEIKRLQEFRRKKNEEAVKF